VLADHKERESQLVQKVVAVTAPWVLSTVSSLDLTLIASKAHALLTKVDEELVEGRMHSVKLVCVIMKRRQQ
jgi:hypothetical protein